MKGITVFCGSSSGNNPVFEEQAQILGQTLAKQNITVVYGGAEIGIMGAVANGALKAGGKVTGVIPEFLATKEVAHSGLTELIVVETMHERKTKMNALCDGVISLPGGFGTFEELFEMLTWAQLGLHQKPIGLLNTHGYYDALISMIETMVEQGFLKAFDKNRLLVSADIDELLSKMKNYVAPAVEKLITKDSI